MFGKHSSFPILVLATLTQLGHTISLHINSQDAINSSTCANPVQRQEWRSLSTAEQEEYISAVKCLAEQPSRLNLSTTLYDDFPYVHNVLNNDIHFVASFLPWHRWFVHIYENALQTSCNFTGAMPYWDWTQDAGHLPSSPLLSNSTTTGFGGNGAGGGFVSPSRPNPLTSCVQDGAFSQDSFTVAYYQGTSRAHCLNRGFNDGFDSDPAKIANMSAYYYTPEYIQNMTEDNGTTNFTTFWDALENGPHGAIHNVLGGDMIPGTSPNDPLFFLHHGQVDRLWWQWQQVAPEVRNTEFTGNRYQNDDETIALISDELEFMGLGTNVTVGDVMTTQNSLLCYTY